MKKNKKEKFVLDYTIKKVNKSCFILTIFINTRKKEQFVCKSEQECKLKLNEIRSNLKIINV